MRDWLRMGHLSGHPDLVALRRCLKHNDFGLLTRLPLKEADQISTVLLEIIRVDQNISCEQISSGEQLLKSLAWFKLLITGR